MKKNAFTILILTAAACRAADIPALNAKPGLWEVTTVTERSGALPIPAETLAKMPPEQRARIEAQFKSKSTPQTSTKQSCFTEADVNKGFGWTNAEKSCKQTIVSATGSKQEVKWECEGAQKGNGSMKVEALDSSHVNAVIDIAMGSGDRVMNMHVTASAKWLSNSCGDVKPNSAK